MSRHPPPRARVLRAATPALAVAVTALAAGLHRPPAALASTAAQQPPAALVRTNCGGCHALVAAGASGKVGPSLDTSTETVNELVKLVTNGPEPGGPMPAFKGSLTAAQITSIAEYVVEVRGKTKATPPEPAATTGAPASSSGLTLTVAPRPHDPTRLTLVARLGKSSPREGTTIAFFVVSTEFKQPIDVPIGTGDTAADGTATLTYAPTWSGPQRFLAAVADTQLRAAADYRVTTSTPGPLATTANPGWPFASLGRGFLDVILAVVAFIWLGLFVTLAVAFGWMPRLAGKGID